MTAPAAPAPRNSAPGNGPGDGDGPAGVEGTIARILSGGSRLAIAFLVVGSVLLLAGGTSPLAQDWPPLDLASLPADLLALRPEGFLWLGLLVAIATPFLRVVASTLAFGRSGERRMVALGIAVLVVLAIAVAAGTAAP